MTEVETTIEDKNLDEKEFYTSYFYKRCDYLDIKYIKIFNASVNRIKPFDKKNKKFVLKTWLSDYISDLYRVGMMEMDDIYFYLEDTIYAYGLPITETYFRSILKKKFSCNFRFTKGIGRISIDFSPRCDLDRVKKDFIEVLESGEYHKIKNTDRLELFKYIKSMPYPRV